LSYRRYAGGLDGLAECQGRGSFMGGVTRPSDFPQAEIRSRKRFLGRSLSSM